MPLLEILTMKVGAATANVILRCWLGNPSALADSSASAVDLIAACVPDFIARRRTETLFQRIAEEVGLRLEPIFDLEFQRLPENERRAAAVAVGTTLERGKLDVDLVVRLNAAPLALERRFREGDPDAKQRELLSEDATALYDLTLREICNYVSEVATTLPSFNDRATLDLLRREDELLSLVRKILANIPTARVSLAEVGRDLARFESQYRVEMARALDRLTLFGLGRSEAVQRYALSVAYITLSAASSHPDGAEKPKAGDASVSDRGATEDTKDSGYDDSVRVDLALSASRRTLIRGEAGSGKTTLLQVPLAFTLRIMVEVSVLPHKRTAPRRRSEPITPQMPQQLKR